MGANVVGATPSQKNHRIFSFSPLLGGLYESSKLVSLPMETVSKYPNVVKNIIADPSVAGNAIVRGFEAIRIAHGELSLPTTETFKGVDVSTGSGKLIARLQEYGILKYSDLTNLRFEGIQYDIDQNGSRLPKAIFQFTDLDDNEPVSFRGELSHAPVQTATIKLSLLKKGEVIDKFSMYSEYVPGATDKSRMFTNHRNSVVTKAGAKLEIPKEISAERDAFIKEETASRKSDLDRAKAKGDAKKISDTQKELTRANGAARTEWAVNFIQKVGVPFSKSEASVEARQREAADMVPPAEAIAAAQGVSTSPSTEFDTDENIQF